MRKTKSVLYYALLVVLLILMGISIFFFIYFNNLRGTDLSLEDLDIITSSQIKYNVKVKDDLFYKSDNETETFVTNMIENVNAYFNISSAFSSRVNGDYSYFITGSVVMGEGNDKVVNEIYKSDINKFKVDGNVINISTNFDINVNEVIKNYHTFALNNNVTSDAYIEYKVTYNFAIFSNKISKSVVDKEDYYIRIPIKDITRIYTNGNESVTTHEFSELNKDDDKLYVIISLEFLGAVLVFILLIALIIKRLMGRETIYEYEIRHILEKFKESIVFLKELPDLSGYKVLFTSSFEDMLDASYTIHSPINYYEVVENKQSTFLVFDGNVVYVYKIDSKNI